MGPTYKKGLTLERINNHGNYEKNNCRWATRLEQAQNTRNVEKAKRYILQNKTLTIREWAKISGIKRTTLAMRLSKYGWPIEKAVTDPVQQRILS